MKVRISAPASVQFLAAQMPPHIIAKFLDEAVSVESCIDYLDASFLKYGLTDGRIRITQGVTESSFDVATEYHSKETLPDSVVAELARATQGQWSDGLGAGCFEGLGDKYDAVIDVSPLGVNEDARTEVVEPTSPGSQAISKGQLFSAAADGDCAKVRECLDAGADVDELVQDTTPLGMAILCGHVGAAKLLLQAGANPNGPPGESMLMQTALSNTIEDSDAAEIARELIGLGADLNGGPVTDTTPIELDENGDVVPMTPLSMARNRDKAMLASVLLEHGAS